MPTTPISTGPTTPLTSGPGASASRRSSVGQVLMPLGRYDGYFDASEPTIPPSYYVKVYSGLNNNDMAARMAHKSMSLHVKREVETDGMVQWSGENIDGPYGGKSKKFIKAGSDVKLQDDTSFAFFQFYGSLRTHLSLYS